MLTVSNFILSFRNYKKKTKLWITDYNEISIRLGHNRKLQGLGGIS